MLEVLGSSFVLALAAWFLTLIVAPLLGLGLLGRLVAALVA